MAKKLLTDSSLLLGFNLTSGRVARASAGTNRGRFSILVLIIFYSP